MALKPAIVDRYLLAEAAKAWAGVAAVLVVLAVGIGFAEFVSEAAAGVLPAAALLTVAGFTALENLVIVLPVSLLLAILLTVGRLCRDNEMAALAAGGIGLARLYRPFGLLALVLALLAGWLSLFLAPQAQRSMDMLRAASAAVLVQSVVPERFVVLDDGAAVFYAGAVSEAGMRNIFIRLRGSLAAEEARPGTETVVTAARAAYQVDRETGAQTLVLYDGRRYQGVPGQADYRITTFAEHGVRLTPGQTRPEPETTDMPSLQLLASGGAAALAELHARLAVPISVLVLALLAVPLGYQRPRAGRYGKLVLGIAVYVAYANLLRLGEVWLVQGAIPVWLGLWWAHALVVVVALGFMGRRMGYLQRRPKAPA